MVRRKTNKSQNDVVLNVLDEPLPPQVADDRFPANGSYNTLCGSFRLDEFSPRHELDFPRGTNAIQRELQGDCTFVNGHSLFMSREEALRIVVSKNRASLKDVAKDATGDKLTKTYEFEWWVAIEIGIDLDSWFASVDFSGREGIFSPQTDLPCRLVVPTREEVFRLRGGGRRQAVNA